MIKVLLSILTIGMSGLLTACSSPFETEFNIGCGAMGGNQSFCSCTYKQVKKHYGSAQLKAISQGQALPEDWPEQVQQAGSRCFSKLINK